jgi:delta 1-pyrroline-5-carboxylate dehydrogenase
VSNATAQALGVAGAARSACAMSGKRWTSSVKYNNIIKRITCPLCKTPNVGVRERGLRIWDHARGQKGLPVKSEAEKNRVYTPVMRQYFELSRTHERCEASGRTEEEAIAMASKKQIKATLYIQWMETLLEKNLEVSQEALNAETAKVYIEVGDTEEECCGKLFKRMFHDNWTARDSVSRLDVEEVDAAFVVKIPEVVSSKSGPVIVVHKFDRYEAMADEHLMEDGSRKLLITSNGQNAYIEITFPPR